MQGNTPDMLRGFYEEPDLNDDRPSDAVDLKIPHIVEGWALPRFLMVQEGSP